MLHTGNEVRIISSNVEHLKKLIGESGIIVSWINKGGIVRYKVMFKDEDQAYFREEELKVI